MEERQNIIFMEDKPSNYNDVSILLTEENILTEEQENFVRKKLGVPDQYPKEDKLLKDIYIKTSKLLIDGNPPCQSVNMQKPKEENQEKRRIEDVHLDVAEKYGVISYLRKTFFSIEDHDEMNPLFETFCSLSISNYEKNPCLGRIFFAKGTNHSSSTNNSTTIQFQEPTDFIQENLQKIRKLIQITSKDRDLCLEMQPKAEKGVYTLTGYIKKPQDGVLIEFLGVSYFSIQNHSGDKIKIMGGRPVYKVNPNNDISSQFNSIFKTNESKDLQAIFECLNDLGHGTMLVFLPVEKIDHERDRLKTQGIGLEKQKLTLDWFRSLSLIDGALLIDNTGTLHAISTIIDGVASSNIGDSSKGARHNSAAKYSAYLQERKIPHLIVVVSDDGPISYFASKLELDTNQNEHNKKKPKPN